MRHQMPNGGARHHIALVDDDRALLKVFSVYLEDNYQVSSFSDPVRAVQAIQSGHFDLVISDIHMPGLDGLALRRHLSRDPSTDIVPFVFLTAQDGALVQERAALLGIDDYLVKPVKKAQLCRVVDRVLRRNARVRAQLGNRLDESITDCLRPAVPARLGDWRFASMARSASAGGGDFIHYRQYGDRITLLLGDAMGHGEQAKFFAHAHAGFLHGLLSSFPDSVSPAVLLARISDAMRVEPVLKTAMMSCIVAQLDPKGILRCAAAAHPAPLYVDAEGARVVEVGGLPPGLMTSYQYAERRIELKQGARLLLYTDGLFDGARGSRSGESLEKEVTDILSNSITAKLESAATQLERCFDRATAGPPEDDATFVIIERG